MYMVAKYRSNKGEPQTGFVYVLFVKEEDDKTFGK